ncbi:senescence-induced receptor-like serine/threonine-protein kinase [Nymphaea colorata]|nr:senescence-induced receptor-like serine/threonine-protein kinase [Nymphaea colorata]
MRRWRDLLLCSLLLVSLLRSSLVLGQEPGFISIDCGGVEEGYVDTTTNISYTSDSNIMKFGERRTIASDYISSVSQYLQHLRSFPNGTRNCYTVQPVISGVKYLLRASFMYGNYDGLNSFPQFELSVGVNSVRTITSSNSSKWLFVEVMLVPTDTYVSVCLLKTTTGIPFISSIELRPMNGTGYKILNDTTAMVLERRLNFGTTDAVTYRYPDDMFDRLWLSPPRSTSLKSINTSHAVVSDSYFEPPSVVMQTALVNPNSSNGILWNPSNLPNNSYFYMSIHIAEIQKLKNNQTREFNITLNSEDWYTNEKPRYLTAETIFSTSSYLLPSGINKVELLPTERSSLSPIINAIELYTVKSLSSSLTNKGDVDALTSIATELGITKDWTGDPCLPQRYAWEGLACSNDSSPRVISLDLSDNGLTGEIPQNLSRLTALESLNLAGNNLTGPIPSFFTDLIHLKNLNLSSNNLTGSVPDVLLQKQQNGSLLLSVSGNEKLCLSSTCNASKKKGNVGVIVGIAVAAALLVVALCIATFVMMKRRKPGSKQPINNSARPVGSSNGYQPFTHVEVTKVTNNFSRKIGEGGYGPVFHGHLRNGQNVAVKILSSKSKQGSKEFQTEVILLSRVHHKNLVSLIGYCDEAENMILIYEYISRGNLQDILSGRSQLNLDWNQRLKVAFGAAQGLDYLHSGCNPAIIHRDVKSANILLNEKLEAKIADFGMSKTGFPDGITHISTKVVGTPGYLDPEYYLTNRLTEKSDVYSFGIVLLELISGLQPIIVEPSGERVHIVNWVRPKLLRGDLASVADPRFCGAYDVGSMWKVAETALECTALKDAERPAMSMVVSYLKEAIESGSPPTVSALVSPSEPLRGVYALSSGTDSETGVSYAAPLAR